MGMKDTMLLAFSVLGHSKFGFISLSSLKLRNISKAFQKSLQLNSSFIPPRLNIR